MQGLCCLGKIRLRERYIYGDVTPEICRSTRDAALLRHNFFAPLFLVCICFHYIWFLLCRDRTRRCGFFLYAEKETKDARGLRPLDPRGCPAFPSPPTFPSALGRLAPLGSLNAGPFTGTLAILRLRKFLRIFGGTAYR